MAIIDRVKSILLSPKTEWPVIEGESGTIKSIYQNYLIYLAAIPAIAGFIGTSIIGFGGFGVSFRVPIGTGIAHMVVSYIVGLALAYVFAMIVDALAPTFKGQKNMLNSFKLVAYGGTAGFVAGIFTLIPSLSILGLLGSLYSIYLFYVGLPVMTKCPPEKALVYTVVVAICGFVLVVILGSLSAMMGIAGPGAAARSAVGAGAADIAISTPQGEIKIDGKKIDDLNKRLENASKNIDQAAKTDPATAPGKAVNEALSALTGTSKREPMSPESMKAVLPGTLGGMPRTGFETNSGNVMGFNGTIGHADYGAGGKTLHLEINDIGAMAGLAAMAGSMNVTGEKETATSTERTYKEGKRMISESAAKDGSHSGYKVILENGVIVDANGTGVDLSTLKAAVGELDLSKLESGKS